MGCHQGVKMSPHGRSFSCLLVLSSIFIVALGMKCYSPIDIIPERVDELATSSIPEIIRKINVTVYLKNFVRNGVLVYRLRPVPGQDNLVYTAFNHRNISAVSNQSSHDGLSNSTSSKASPVVLPDDVSSKLNHTCAGIDDICYLFSEIRWGPENETGSDHTVGGRFSPMEMQHYFFNTSNVTLAVSVRYRISQKKIALSNRKKISLKHIFARLVGRDKVTEESSWQVVDEESHRNMTDARNKRSAATANVGDTATTSPSSPGSVTPIDRADVGPRSTAPSVSPGSTKSNASSASTPAISSPKPTTPTANNTSTSQGSSTSNTPVSSTANSTASVTATETTTFAIANVSTAEMAIISLLEEDVNETAFALEDFLLPEEATYYNYRGNMPGECGRVVEWFVYEEEADAHPSVLQALRSMNTTINDTHSYQTHFKQMSEPIKVYKRSANGTYDSPSPQLASGNTQTHFFTPVLFLTVVVIVLVDFFVLY